MRKIGDPLISCSLTSILERLIACGDIGEGYHKGRAAVYQINPGVTAMYFISAFDARQCKNNGYES